MMKMEINELIRSQRKTLQLQITSDARLIVRAPLRLSLKTINKFVDDKKVWIEEKKAIASFNHEKVLPRHYHDGDSIKYLGNPYTLVFSENQQKISLRGNSLIIPAQYLNNQETIIKKWYHKQAKDYITARLQYFSHQFKIPYQSMKITQARKRWGSCSSRNALNFTWRLIMANQQAIDYVILHELGHVLVKNHSKLFWRKMEEMIPSYPEYKYWLKMNQYLLDLF